MEEILDFYHRAFHTGQEILRSVLDDREAYIRAKEENPAWSDFTLEMGIFNNQAMRMVSIMKYSFGYENFDFLKIPSSVGDQQLIGEDVVKE
jgi:hypothetical protein